MLYQVYYGFKEQPFSLLPDPSFLYLGQKHSNAFAMLEYGLMNRAGFTVITGEMGSGKTTLIRHLLDQIGDEFTVGLISNTHEKMDKLLRWVLRAFNQEFSGSSRVDLYDAFTRFLIEQYAKKRRTVLIIDEAQNLSSQVLEELRMLPNINADKHMVLQLILVGQTQLRELMRQPELQQLRQRVSADYHLKALDENETRAYILHRPATPGATWRSSPKRPATGSTGPAGAYHG
jgi:type II secretory pathway predicted ATPase ExeA